MPSVQSTGSIPRLLQEGLYAVIDDEYKAYESQYSGMLDVKMSDKAYEDIALTDSFKVAALKNEGASITYDSSKQIGQQRWVHGNYALGCIVTAEAVEDNRYQDRIESDGRMLARSMREAEEIVGASPFNSGYDSAVTMWDGQPLFSSAHVLSGGGTMSNVLAVAAPLSEEALEDAVVSIANFRDNKGKRINVKPLKLVVPRALPFVAERILKSSLQNDSANNATNALKAMRSIPEGYMVSQYLTDQTDWFIKTDCDKGGMFFFRNELQNGQDNDFGTGNYRHKVSRRFVAGVGDFRAYFGSGEN